MNATTPMLECPKSMVYGPCAGPRSTGRCELGDRPCPFLDVPVARWVGHDTAVAPASEIEVLARTRKIVFGELPEAGADHRIVRRAADALAGHLDAVLFGDTNWSRVRLPPSHRASIVAAAGLRPWPGLNCRDRNRVALEGELAALVAMRVAGVHCVTGDHPGLGHRPDAAAVFDLDSTRLAALAAAMGLTVSVAEAPLAPPADQRATRLAEKVRAGARVAILPSMADLDALERFVGSLALLPQPPRLVLATVPLATSPAALERFAAFGESQLPAEIHRAASGASSRHDGIAAATDLAESLLTIEGLHGVLLSVATIAGSELDDAAAIVEVSHNLGRVNP